jgi:quinol monooxygenase YgiN
MVIVCGHLLVEPDQRAGYLAGCRPVVEAGRAAPGNLEFALAADLVDPARITILERWASRDAVEAFRNGPSEEQAGAIRGGSVVEYDVSGQRTLL